MTMASAQVKEIKTAVEDAMELPKYKHEDYSPKTTVVYTRHEEEADDLILTLKQGPVALDMEWRFFPFRRPGGGYGHHENRTAVVQIADSSGMILVIQVYSMRRFPVKLQELIENPTIPKIGVNILNDGKKLFRDYGILAANLVELGAIALVADPAGKPGGQRKIVSLAKLVEHYCKKILEKGSERTGNWELVLDQNQLDYAANDPHSSLMVYYEIMKKAEQNNVTVTNLEETYSSSIDKDLAASLIKTTSSFSNQDPLPSMTMQYLRAYHYWHNQNMSLEKMCVELSLKSKGFGQVVDGDLKLKPGTVITYIINALKKIWKLVQQDISSWTRHREWIVQMWKKQNSLDLNPILDK
ncbi:ribonuclease H-like domain-containing protein [Crucibulum laeve]|uniref:Ribonuclease H-like domain-containing protein n=1 Tax=Crucibulum laeve TaxID=68775 RepID=A0A5C3LEV4_9AGAR|nr:ribonuclease H-like domain-containing protein [Crucibulum laeve]